MGWEVQRYVEDSGRLSLNNAMRTLIIYYNYRQAIAAQVKGRQNWTKLSGLLILIPYSLPLIPAPIPFPLSPSFTLPTTSPYYNIINTAPQCCSSFPIPFPCPLFPSSPLVLIILPLSLFSLSYLLYLLLSSYPLPILTFTFLSLFSSPPSPCFINLPPPAPFPLFPYYILLILSFITPFFSCPLFLPFNLLLSSPFPYPMAAFHYCFL